MSSKFIGIFAMGIFTALNSFHAALLFFIFGHTVHGESLSAFFNGHIQAAGWVNFFLNLISVPGVMASFVAISDQTKGASFKGVILMLVVFFMSLLVKVVALICVACTKNTAYTIVDMFFVVIAGAQMLAGSIVVRVRYRDSREMDAHDSNSEAPQPAERDCPIPTTIAASMDTASMDTAYDENKEFPV